MAGPGWRTALPLGRAAARRVSLADERRAIRQFEENGGAAEPGDGEIDEHAVLVSTEEFAQPAAAWFNFGSRAVSRLSDFGSAAVQNGFQVACGENFR